MVDSLIEGNRYILTGIPASAGTRVPMHILLASRASSTA